MNGTDKSHTTVGVYLQTWPYFINAGLPFQLKDKEWGEQWVSRHSVNVAIHARKPDYGLRASETFYIMAVEKLRNLTKPDGEKLRFVITTDDHEWVKSKSVFDGMLVSEGHSPSQDMAINAACKHMIMSVGTFGWWGAYFNENRRDPQSDGQNGYTIYWMVPFNWDSTYTNNAPNHNSSEFYLPHWIPIRAPKD